MPVLSFDDGCLRAYNAVSQNLSRLKKFRLEFILSQTLSKTLSAAERSLPKGGNPKRSRGAEPKDPTLPPLPLVLKNSYHIPILRLQG